MDTRAVLLFLAYLVSSAVSECVRVRGRVECPTDAYRIQNVRVAIIDRDVLPWESDDLMGETRTASNGSFTVEGCGDDLGWWNQPDPFLEIEHRCPEVGHNVAITMRRTLVYLERSFLPSETVLEEVIRLDKDQEEVRYTGFMP